MKELELYKVFVASKVLNDEPITDSIKYGFVTDKAVCGEDLLLINQYYSKNKLDSNSLLKTLFTKEDLQSLSLRQKVIVQILHYLSCGNFGTKTFEDTGAKLTFDIVKVVSKEELLKLIESDIYESKPLSTDKVSGIVGLVKRFNFKIDYSKVKNNEFKSHILSESSIKLDGFSGDDAVRAICFVSTGSTMLIKSKEVLQSFSNVEKNFLFVKIENILKLYDLELSNVFNRHKKIFMAIKQANKNCSNTINRISRLSKTKHIPLKEVLNKVFISKYLKYQGNNIVVDIMNDLDKIEIVDKFKMINNLRVAKSDMKNRVFVIRNGKVWAQEDRPEYSNKHQVIHDAIVSSLINDLSYLKGLKIKYPENIDYALPISEKQSCGHIPFGTVITSNKNNGYLTAGMYWENSGGANDLDLSSVSIDGSRTGWGQISSYCRDIVFSGDITNASNGAIEYIANNSDKPAILINNIFNGEDGAEFKIVVGNSEKVSKDSYIENPIVEVKTKFGEGKRTMCLGALTKDKFIFYPVSIGNKSVSSKRDKAILPFLLVDYMKLSELFKLIGIETTQGADFDLDLSIENLTFDKLQNLLKKGCNLKKCMVQ